MQKERKTEIPEPALIAVPMGHSEIEECRSVSFIYFKNAKYPDGALAYAGSIWPEDMAHEEIYFRCKTHNHLDDSTLIPGGGVLTLDRNELDSGKIKLTARISKDSHTYPGYIDREIINTLWQKIVANLDQEKFETEAIFLK